jgi:hypothetical protein
MRNLDGEAAGGIGLGLKQERRAAVAEVIGAAEASKAPWWGVAVISTGVVASVA